LTAASCPKEDFYTPPTPQKSATDFCTALSKKHHLYCVLKKKLKSRPKSQKKYCNIQKKRHLYCVLKKRLKKQAQKSPKKSWQRGGKTDSTKSKKGSKKVYS